MKMEFSCQGIEMFSFLTTNMAVTTSHANQQLLSTIVILNSAKFCGVPQKKSKDETNFVKTLR